MFDNLSVKAYANIMHSKRNYNSDLSYSRNPIFPVYDDKGNYWQYSETDYYNPMAITDLRKNETNGLNLISSVLVDYQILPYLNLKGQVIINTENRLRMYITLKNILKVVFGIKVMVKLLIVKMII